MEGPFIVLLPLWIVFSLGAWALILDWMLVAWVGLTAAVLGPAQPRAGWKHRVVSGLIGVGLMVSALSIARVTHVFFPSSRPGLAAAALGGIAIIIGVSARGISRLKRSTVLLTGLTAIAVFALHYTSLGMAMLSWYMD
jgi:hypothetical protein